MNINFEFNKNKCNIYVRHIYSKENNRYYIDGDAILSFGHNKEFKLTGCFYNLDYTYIHLKETVFIPKLNCEDDILFNKPLVKIKIPKSKRYLFRIQIN